MAEPAILIVEDHVKMADSISKGLEENGFTTEVAYDGFIGKRLSDAKDYELIILDINLPQINGYELCAHIRKKNASVPIIMLTAMGSTEDKLLGFDQGADDYIVKPFEFRELLARIKALLKRVQPDPKSLRVLRVADLEIDLDSKTVKRGNISIDLTAKEFLLLEFLVQNKGKVVSKADIAEKIWNITFDTGTNVIEVYVNFLRKKIDKNFPVKLIHTHIGMGYILKAGDDANQN
ncbi:MAG: response regulator transcription factor [Lentimicrobium sp.]|jgi:DNA-binding response OmpR family regulator|nr:response regulator transcription factor [Lentimicrobium sp.]MDY0024689.1 response regulator transcription factor [Lentimicrobium sp.]HAH60101.1 DNA-binding response regulator [Bacteroidales bacterium]